jgi:DNA excision repair protein ERCC-2
MKLFPHAEVRKVQSEMIKDVSTAVSGGKHIIAHAPTGLGKTVAALVPALEYAIEHGKTIIFLTPKHTQHQIVVETVRLINQAHNTKIKAVDFIGKQWMCPVPGINVLTSKDFAEYCKEIKKEERCVFYNKVRKNLKLTESAQKLLKELKESSALNVEEVCKLAAQKEMCPYEITCEIAKEANVIIGDYYHIFHPNVRKAFITRIGKQLKDCIVIVDEAQNLPDRIREVLSSKLSSFSIRSAVREAAKTGNEKISAAISELGNILLQLAAKIEKEKTEAFVSKEEFFTAVSAIGDYGALVSDLQMLGEQIRTEEKRSFVGSIGSFLQEWLEAEGDGYTRIIRKEKFKDKEYLQLLLKCLDPAVSSRELFEECHSAVLMSGTLMPNRMYRDVLGLAEQRTRCAEYENPFPSANRLALIVPDTTTQYKRRKTEEFKKIAKWCSELSNSIKGNVALFFPSYHFRNAVLPIFERQSKKTIFVELSGETR